MSRLRLQDNPLPLILNPPILNIQYSKYVYIHIYNRVSGVGLGLGLCGKYLRFGGVGRGRVYYSGEGIIVDA